MFNILYWATLFLNFAGVVFAAVFIWINTVAKYTDAKDRNGDVLKITKTSVWLTMLFALLSCLLTDSENVLSAISKTSHLYSVVAISWLVVLLICALGMLYSFVSKSKYESAAISALGSVLKIALTASIISILLSWLFS